MTKTEQEFINSVIPAEHAERIAERNIRRLPSSRAREMAMAAAAMSGVALGIWIVASFDNFQTGLTSVAIILTLATSALAAVASRDFHSLSQAIRALRSENERMADHLWEASESEERASSLFDQLGDLVVVFDARRIISDANLNFAMALGMPIAEVQGRSLSSLGIEVPRGRTRPGNAPQDVLINSRWYSWIELRSPGAGFEKPLFRAVESGMLELTRLLIGFYQLRHANSANNNVNANSFRLNESYAVDSQINDAVVVAAAHGTVDLVLMLLNVGGASPTSAASPERDPASPCATTFEKCSQTHVATSDCNAASVARPGWAVQWGPPMAALLPSWTPSKACSPW